MVYPMCQDFFFLEFCRHVGSLPPPPHPPPNFLPQLCSMLVVACLMSVQSRTDIKKVTDLVTNLFLEADLILDLVLASVCIWPVLFWSLSPTSHLNLCLHSSLKLSCLWTFRRFLAFFFSPQGNLVLSQLNFGTTCDFKFNISNC